MRYGTGTRIVKLTSKNMSLQVFISGKRLTAVGTEDHGDTETERSRQKGR